MFECKSTNTLQNSNISYSIPKCERFKGTYNKSISDSSYDISTNISMQKRSLGLGERTNFIIGKGNPSPDTYNLGSSLKSKIAATFKSRHPNRELDYKLKIPGPANYDTSRNFNISIPPTLKFRHSLYYEEDIKQKKHCISPQTYFPDHHKVQNNRFEQIKFLKGKKNSVLGNINTKAFPGPGTYNLPGIFEYKNIKKRFKPPLN